MSDVDPEFYLASLRHFYETVGKPLDAPCIAHVFANLDVVGGGRLRLCFFCPTVELELPGLAKTIHGVVSLADSENE